MAESAMVATKFSHSQLKSSSLETVTDVSQLYDKWINSIVGHRAREYRNWRAYSGVDAGQWTEEDIENLKNEGRDPDQFNIIQRRVDVLQGNEMTQIWDFDWVPVEGQRSSGTEAIKETYYCDKELMNFDTAIEQTIKDGLIYRGTIEMNISKKYNPAGNINLERLTPGYYFWDPYWMTDDDNDCEQFIKVGYFNAKQIKRIWNKTGSRVRIEVNNLEQSNGDYEVKDFDLMSDVTRETKGHLMRVIEKSYLEHEKKERLYGWTYNQDGFGHIVPFPETEEKEYIQKFAEANDIQIEDTFIAPHERRILKTITVCPQLIEEGLLVDDKRHEVQVNRLNRFHFSYNRAYGVDKGIVDDLYDLQKNINRREAKETDIIETSTGGGKLINENIFKTPAQKARFMEQSNDPSYREFIDGDELEKGVSAIIDLHSPQMPGAGLDLGRMYQLADTLSPVTTAQTGTQESAATSGVLFERQLAVSRIGQLPLDKRIKKMMNDIGEAYFYQWQITYDGVPREFSTRDGEHSVFLNEIMYDSTGRKGTRNQPSYTPRSRVIVTESPKSETWQMRKRFFYADLLKFIPQNYQSQISFIIGIIIKTLDVSDKEKSEFESLMKMQQFKDMMSSVTELANMQAGTDQAKLTSMQAQMMMQQMMQQMQGMGQPGQEGGQEEPMPEQVNMEGGSPMGEPPMIEGPAPVAMEEEQLGALTGAGPGNPAQLAPV